MKFLRSLQKLILTLKNTLRNPKKRAHEDSSSTKKVPFNKSIEVQGNRKKFFLAIMNLRHYMLEICLKVSMKVTYMNYSLKNYVTTAGKQLAGERVGDVSGEISYAHFLEI